MPPQYAANSELPGREGPFQRDPEWKGRVPGREQGEITDYQRENSVDAYGT
jgi:hypothetical protein